MLMLKRKNNLEGNKRRRPHGALIYFVLATLSLSAVAVSLGLNLYQSNLYQESVEMNTVWTSRLDQIAKFLSISSVANVAGNDVFDNHLVDQQDAIFNAEADRFRQAIHDFEKELTANPCCNPPDINQFDEPMAQTRSAWLAMESQAQSIFDLLRKGDTTTASQHMAAFDRSYADLHYAMASIRGQISGIIDDHLAEQNGAVGLIHKLEIGIVSLITLVAVAIAFYGRRLSIVMRRLDDERERALVDLNNQKYSVDQHSIVSIANIHGDITYANDKFCELSGYSLEELVGQNHRLVKSDEHHRAFYRNLWKTISSGDPWRGEIKNRAKDGTYYWVDATIVPFKDEYGKITQYVAIRTDITAAKESERRYQLAVNGSGDGLWDWDLLTDRVYYAPQWRRMLGIGPEETVTDTPEEWTSRIDPRDIGAFMQEFDHHLRGLDQTFEVELRMIHTHGKTAWMLCRGAVVRDKTGRAIRVAGSLADITEIKEAQDKLRQAAEHDRLTDLPNRELFKKKLDKAIQRAQDNPDFKLAVLFFDFDRFKVINDSLGHNVGDALLIDIAKLFEYSLRHGDTAARFGGDEFVVLLNDLRDFDEALETAERLLKTFAKPHDLLGHSVTSTASIGLVTNEQDYTSADDMIRDADAAMYQAKDTGKNKTVVFDKAMHAQAMDRLTLEADLRSAISDDQLKLLYQPIIELSTGELTGFEALIRWEHPKRGLVSPADFITIAEDTGLIVDIGSWIIQTASQQIADWNGRLCPDRALSVNVNVSKRQLLNPTFRDEALKCRHQHNLQPQVLKLEITESVISDERADVVTLLRQLREDGFPIVMDDFGTGVSSLSTLHDYPIDVLKIDQSFIRVLDRDRSLLAVVAAITNLAENLGILTVAEGVESPDIVGALQSINCTWAQGYHFAKPLTAPEAEAFILSMGEQKLSA